MRVLLWLALVLGLSNTPTIALADLIGDTVDAGIFSGGVRRTGFGMDGPFVVQAGPTDQRQYSTAFRLDVEGDKFLIDYSVSSFTTPVPWAFGVEFRIFDLDWVGQPTVEITGLTIETNVPGWSDTRASFGPHSVTLDWDSLFVDRTNYFAVYLQTTPVPEPCSALLLAAGLGVLGFARRNGRRATRDPHP